MRWIIIHAVKEEKYLEIMIQDILAPEKHINKVSGEPCCLLQNMSMAFHYLDETR